MKLFSMTHLFFDTPPEKFTESTAPDWLVSEAFKWWFDNYVLKLEIGENIKTDFRDIRRLE